MPARPSAPCWAAPRAPYHTDCRSGHPSAARERDAAAEPRPLAAGGGCAAASAVEESAAGGAMALAGGGGVAASLVAGALAAAGSAEGTSRGSVTGVVRVTMSTTARGASTASNASPDFSQGGRSSSSARARATTLLGLDGGDGHAGRRRGVGHVRRREHVRVELGAGRVLRPRAALKRRLVVTSRGGRRRGCLLACGRARGAAGAASSTSGSRG